MSDNPDLSLTRTDGGIHLHTRGSTLFFTHTMWEEFSNMIRDFNITGARQMQNFVPLPTRTPLHDNIPASRKPTIEDLA